MADARPKGRLKSIGDIQKKGEYFFRTVELETGMTGEHWSKDKATLENHDRALQEGLEIEYDWIKGAEGKGDKLRVYMIKDGGGSSSSGSSGVKQDTGKRKSEYAKGAEAKEDYWQRKFEWEVANQEQKTARETKNDKKLEYQSVRNCIAPFYLNAYAVGELSLDGAITALESKTTAIYNAHNPNEPIKDVTKG